MRDFREKNKLAEKILPPDAHAEIDPVEAEAEEAAVQMEIVGDRQLSCEDRVIEVKPDALALNGFLRVRDRWAKGSELRDAMETSLTPAPFSQRISKLAADLKQLAAIDDEIIEKRGVRNAQEYRLSPRVLFVDRREEADELTKRGVLWSEDELREMSGETTIPFEETSQRREVVSNMLNSVEGARGVNSYPMSLDQRQNENLLDRETLQEALSTLEYGISAFLIDDTPEGAEKIEAAGRAYGELFASIIPFIQKIARIRSRTHLNKTKVNQDELFQAGCVGAMHYIAGPKQSTPLSRRTEFFYAQCKTAVRRDVEEMAVEDTGARFGWSPADYRLWRQISYSERDLTNRLRREPSPAEITADLQEMNIECQLEDVERCMAKFDLHLHVDVFEYTWERFLNPDSVNDPINTFIKQQYYEELADYLFSSNELEAREKMALSFYYGVFSTFLVGKAYAMRGKTKDELYVYPDEEGFTRSSAGVMGSSVKVGKLFGTVNVDEVLKSALKKAKPLAKQFDEWD